jgi:hypothetical protein
MSIGTPVSEETPDTGPRQGCPCIRRYNEYLAKTYGAYLDTIETMPPSGDFGERIERIRLQTRKLTSDRPANVPLVPRYCPFCGKDYAQGLEPSTPPAPDDVTAESLRDLDVGNEEIIVSLMDGEVSISTLNFSVYGAGGTFVGTVCLPRGLEIPFSAMRWTERAEQEASK